MKIDFSLSFLTNYLRYVLDEFLPLSLFLSLGMIVSRDHWSVFYQTLFDRERKRGRIQLLNRIFRQANVRFRSLNSFMRPSRITCIRDFHFLWREREKEKGKTRWFTNNSFRAVASILCLDRKETHVEQPRLPPSSSPLAAAFPYLLLFV